MARLGIINGDKIEIFQDDEITLLQEDKFQTQQVRADELYCGDTDICAEVAALKEQVANLESSLSSLASAVAALSEE